MRGAAKGSIVNAALDKNPVIKAIAFGEKPL